MDMNRLFAAAMLLAVLCPALSAVPPAGSICIAPSPSLPEGRPGRLAPVGAIYCTQEKFAVKIDSQDAIPWPTEKSVRIGGLDLDAKHRVVVLCGGKAQQTFLFRYSEFKSRDLCLFINDMYWTVQLWEKKRAPWCRCIAAP